MQMPEQLKTQIAKALEIVRQNLPHGLKPYERILIYDAFGPTFAPSDKFERIGYIQEGNLTFTYADHARAWTSILTARQLLPLWEKAWEVWKELNGEDSADEVELEEGQEPDVYKIDSKTLPSYLLDLGEGVLKGRVSVQKAWHEANEAHYIVGSILEYSGEDYPIVSGMICDAALEALYQCCGLGPFNSQQIDETTTDQDLELTGGATALPAMMAYCLKQDEITDFIVEGQKQAEFWEHWLTETIPAAWKLVDENNGSINFPQQEVPFRETIHVTAYKVGTVIDPKTGEKLSVFSTKPKE